MAEVYRRLFMSYVSPGLHSGNWLDLQASVNTNLDPGLLEVARVTSVHSFLFLSDDLNPVPLPFFLNRAQLAFAPPPAPGSTSMFPVTDKRVLSDLGHGRALSPAGGYYPGGSWMPERVFYRGYWVADKLYYRGYFQKQSDVNKRVQFGLDVGIAVLSGNAKRYALALARVAGAW